LLILNFQTGRITPSIQSKVVLSYVAYARQSSQLYIYIEKCGTHLSYRLYLFLSGTRAHGGAGMGSGRRRAGVRHRSACTATREGGRAVRTYSGARGMWRGEGDWRWMGKRRRWSWQGEVGAHGGGHGGRGWSVAERRTASSRRGHGKEACDGQRRRRSRGHLVFPLDLPPILLPPSSSHLHLLPLLWRWQPPSATAHLVLERERTGGSLFFYK
jgi:hypothetical protein